jgi:hypothetical protein
MLRSWSIECISLLLVPFGPAIVQINLNGQNQHHANDSFNEINDIQSGAKQWDNTKQDETAIKGDIF